MRKAPVPPAPKPASFPPHSPSPSPSCRDDSPKQEPYFFCAIEGELHLAVPGEQKVFRAMAA